MHCDSEVTQRQFRGAGGGGFRSPFFSAPSRKGFYVWTLLIGLAWLVLVDDDS